MCTVTSRAEAVARLYKSGADSFDNAKKVCIHYVCAKTHLHVYCDKVP